MKKIYASFKDKVLQVYMILAVAALVVMIIACFYQVFGRYVLNASPGWTEELSRFTFIWLSALGSTIDLDRGAHASITILSERLPNISRKVLTLILHIVVAVIAVLLIIYGWQLAAATMKTPSAALKIPMAYINIALSFAGFGMLLTSVNSILTAFDEKEEKEVKT